MSRPPTDLRKYAKGMPCLLRIPSVCRGNAETTVLCHIKRGWCGSLKPPDVVAVWGCNRCHDAIDGRVRTQYTRVELDSMILRALCEQLCVYVKQEVLSW